MEHEILEDIILEAIKKVQINDQELISHKMEWSTAHRLAVNLEGYFSGFNVDCEYNKMGEEFDPKHDSHKNHKRPDIVIHKRGKLEPESNLLVIEIKMEQGQDEDEEKLLDFTDAPNEHRPFQYKYGLKISFLPTLQLRWFRERFMFKQVTHNQEYS